MKIMKKIYLSPEMDVIELKKQTLLAGSVNAPVDNNEQQSNENALAPGYIW